MEMEAFVDRSFTAESGQHCNHGLPPTLLKVLLSDISQIGYPRYIVVCHHVIYRVLIFSQHSHHCNLIVDGI